MAGSLSAPGRLAGRALLVCLLLSVPTSGLTLSQVDSVNHRILSPEESRSSTDLRNAILGMDHRTDLDADLDADKYFDAGLDADKYFDDDADAYSALRHPRYYAPRSFPEDHSPRGALWRSAVLPGWGQIYNRQYVKLPFVYGAIGGLVVAIVRFDDDYDLYNRAFQYKAFQELVDADQLEENPKASFKPSYDRIADDVGPVSSGPLEIRRNNLRRGRDLSAIGLGLVYGLAMLDAYVSAHLLDFDVGESLGVNVTPGTDGFRIAARVTLSRPGK